jgi:hypothetical protein
MIQREERHAVLIPARMRWEGRWTAASIRNVSSKGMMVRTEAPPSPGTYVEMQLPSGVVAARTVWTMNQACGLKLQDRLDIGAILGKRSASVAGSGMRHSGAPRPRREPTPAELRARSERNQQLSSLMQFVIVVAVGVCAAGSLGWEVYKVLSAPMVAVEGKLA